MRKLVGTITLLLLLAVVAALGYAAYRISRYQQHDDSTHLAAKRKYLEGLPKVAEAPARPPNVVVILFDDLGYGDLGVYGSKSIKTPQIDSLAAQGARLTDYYAAAPYCTPSRAALLTGRYPVHAGLTVINFPASSPFAWLARLAKTNTRLPAEEITVAEVLKAAGYATGMIGKWHLGDQAPSLPNQMGFQDFFGVHHSNDMTPFALLQNDKVIEPDPIDQTTLTQRYTSQAVSFIDRNREHPFFLYMAHSSPHIPLHVSEKREGSSDGGLYGDVVEELDGSVGAVVAALRRNGLDHNTIVIVTSDNGPWYEGSTGDLRGRKNDVFEGGMRVPFVAWWPGRIPAGRIFADIAMGIDLLPTVLDLLDLPAPPDRLLDGKSLLPLLQERGREPHQELYYFKGAKLLGVRNERYKYTRPQYLFPGTQIEMPVMALIQQGPWLIDLSLDRNESYDIGRRQPGIAHRLQLLLDAKDRNLAANPRGWK